MDPRDLLDQVGLTFDVRTPRRNANDPCVLVRRVELRLPLEPFLLVVPGFGIVDIYREDLEPAENRQLLLGFEIDAAELADSRRPVDQVARAIEIAVARHMPLADARLAGIAAAQVEDHLRRGFDRSVGVAGIDTALEARAGVADDAVAAAGCADHLRIEQGAFEQYVGGALVDAGAFAADDSAKADGAALIRR